MNAKVLISIVILLSAGASYGQEQAGSSPVKPKSLVLGGVNVGTKAPPLKVVEWLSEVPDMKGKFVALDFWGTSCKPCISGFPHVSELQKRFKDKIVFIAATTNEGIEDTYTFDGSSKIEFYSVIQPASNWVDFNIQGIPYMVVIDPKGIVRFSGNGYDLTGDMLLDIFSKYGN
jgi:thiol-disulfide isomerase/thioredoxin